MKEVDAVRAEIVYKMQLAHRVTLAILVAPTVVLPAMAKLAEQIAGSPSKLGATAPQFDFTILLIFLCLPPLLLWGELFCQSQVNGIRRAGDWLRGLEQTVGLAKSGAPHVGWETWVSSEHRRRWDDDVFQFLTRSLVLLYYCAASWMASVLGGELVSHSGLAAAVGLAPEFAKPIARDLALWFFGSLYAAYFVFKRRMQYSDLPAPELQAGAVLEALITQAGRAYRAPTGDLKFPYVVSSLGTGDAAPADPLRVRGETARVLGVYEELYDWDGTFCGAALLDAPAPLNGVLEGVVKNFLAAQHGEDGFVPRTLTPEGTQIDPMELCKPLLAQGALAITRHRGDQRWLEPAEFAALTQFVEHWQRERRGPSGMYMWRSALESGVDNNAALVHFPPLSIEAVDATCYVARECAALALLAAERGQDTLALRMRRHALDAQQALLKRSWDDSAGFFWNLHVESGLPVKIASWTGLLPLWGSFLPRDVLHRMIERNLGPEGGFLSAAGIATLARSEVSFNAARRAYIWDHTKQKRGEVSNWQGPAWVLPNALLADALAAAGERDLAQSICRRTLSTLARDLTRSGTLHECYDADGGQPLWAPGFVSWNALAVRMLQWSRGQVATVLPEGLSSASLHTP